MSKEEKKSFPSSFAAFCIGSGVTLAALRIGGVIDWAWWLATMPLWGPAALLVVIFVALVIAAMVCAAVKVIVDEMNKKKE